MSAAQDRLNQVDDDDRKIKDLKGLLKVAKCPNNCIKGAIPINVGDDVELEQCQWCAERKRLVG